jgi:glyoxylase-like metal-dependent hydrolase (beta-lactamase superfamily II)
LNEPVDEVAEGILRLTLPLPLGPGHVHCYLLRSGRGWMLVDTGLGLPGIEDLLADRLAALDGAVSSIVITHFHPDHVGGAQPAAKVTGAPVFQGELDYAQSEQVWGSDDWPARIAAWFRRNGVPGTLTEELQEEDRAARPFIRFARDPELLHPGDEVDGWAVVALPGHADGHVGLVRDGVLVAGDHLLPEITPAIGLYPEQRPDPLGDYLESLERTVALAPLLALPAHGDPIADPAGRAREIADHHGDRLAQTQAALTEEPQTGYDLSYAVFGGDLSPSARRFAVAETLSHLERLVFAGRARKAEIGQSIAYTRR